MRGFMKMLLAFLFIPALALGGEGAAGKAASAESEFAEKAEQLVKDKAGRTEKILAVYTFVRDEVAQVATQYG